MRITLLLGLCISLAFLSIGEARKGKDAWRHKKQKHLGKFSKYKDPRDGGLHDTYKGKHFSNFNQKPPLPPKNFYRRKLDRKMKRLSKKKYGAKMHKKTAWFEIKSDADCEMKCKLKEVCVSGPVDKKPLCINKKDLKKSVKLFQRFHKKEIKPWKKFQKHNHKKDAKWLMKHEKLEKKKHANLIALKKHYMKKHGHYHKKKEYFDEAIKKYKSEEHMKKQDLDELMKKHELEESMKKHDLEEQKKKYDLEESMKKHDLEKQKKKYGLEESMKKHDLEKQKKKYGLEESMKKHDLEEQKKKYDLEESMEKHDQEEKMKKYDLEESMKKHDLEEQMKKYDLEESMKKHDLEEMRKKQESKGLKDLYPGFSKANDKKNEGAGKKRIDFPGKSSGSKCSSEKFVQMRTRLMGWFHLLHGQDHLARKAHGGSIAKFYKHVSVKKELREHDGMECGCLKSALWQFHELDKTSDDYLSTDELAFMEENSLEPCIKPFLNSCDRDGDLKLSSDEWCCCFSHIVAPCFKRIDEIKKAGDKDAFIPRCDKEGYYMREQCKGDEEGRMLCWCVDINGNELKSTASHGRAHCSKYALLEMRTKPSF